MRDDPNDAMIVSATVELGRNLGLRVVAEGVEDRATFDELARIGCDMAQGFEMSQPLAAIDLTRWLEERGGSAALATPGHARGGSAARAETGRGHLQVF